MKLIKKHTFKHFNSNNPRSVIFHIDLGTERGTTDWIMNGPKSISYNYYITRDGRVIEFVPFKYGAWHSGVVDRPTEKARAFFSGVNPNKKSVGICYEGRTVQTMPSEAQIKACVELIAYLKQSGVKIDEYFSHQEITSYKPVIVHKFEKAVRERLPDSQSKEEKIKALQTQIMVLIQQLLALLKK